MITDNKLEIVENSIAPVRAHSDDAAIDLFIQETTVIQPNETLYLRAGVKLDLQPGYAGLVISRSSVFKRGLAVIDTLVDCGYKGEISTIVSNIIDEPVRIEKGDRLGQLILVPYYQFANEGVLQNSKGNREPEAKFGSSGSNKLAL